MASRLLIALALMSLASCAVRPPVHFSSDPPGARVVVDDVDSGFVTPCQLDLPKVDARQIQFVLPGYQTATRRIIHKNRGELVYWRDASVSYNTWNFPTWLSWRDFIWFWKDKSGEFPNRIFVRLRRAADR